MNLVDVKQGNERGVGEILVVGQFDHGKRDGIGPV
jgi:hypothetical protein